MVTASGVRLMEDVGMGTCLSRHSEKETTSSSKDLLVISDVGNVIVIELLEEVQSNLKKT